MDGHCSSEKVGPPSRRGGSKRGERGNNKKWSSLPPSLPPLSAALLRLCKLICADFAQIHRAVLPTREIVKEEARETGEFVFVLGSFDRPERQLFCHHGAWAAATASPDSGMPMSKHRRCDGRQTQKQEENITELTTAAAMMTTAPR